MVLMIIYTMKLIFLDYLDFDVFLASSMYTCDFFTFYTALPHNLSKENFTKLIEHVLNREVSFHLACNENFLTAKKIKCTVMSENV